VAELKVVRWLSILPLLIKVSRFLSGFHPLIENEIQFQ